MKAIANACMCATLVMSPTAANAQNFQIEIRAFIANDYPSSPGFVRPVPEEPEEEGEEEDSPYTFAKTPKFMIPGPGIPFFTTEPLPLVGSCYNTNDRGFSSTGSAKAYSDIRFTYNKGAISNIDIDNDTGESLRYDCKSGKIDCDEYAPADKIKAVPTISGNLVTVNVTGEASNPCVVTPTTLLPDVVNDIVAYVVDKSTPAIKWDGSFTIDPVNRTVRFQGTIANFPSYEAYLYIDDEDAIPIFQESPNSGATAWSLLTTRAVDKTISYPEPPKPKTPPKPVPPSIPAAPAIQVLGKWQGSYGGVNSTFEFRPNGVAIKSNYAGSQTWTWSGSGTQITLKSELCCTTLTGTFDKYQLKMTRTSGHQPGPSYVLYRQ